VAQWLDAVLYKTDFRPVKLHHWIKVGHALRDCNNEVRLSTAEQLGRVS